MRKLSKITKGLIGQPMFSLLAKIKELEREGKQIIHFEIGDPNFNTPREIIDAAKASLDRNETHYTDSMGLWELRQEIRDFVKQSLGYRPDSQQILIMPANGIIDFVIRCVANPGDEVICPDPGFPTYFAVMSYLGIKCKRIPLREENKFRMAPADIRKSITKKTRLIIINSPNNPTGSIMTEEELKEVADIAAEHDIYLLSDEVYSKINYDMPCHSPSVYDHCRERTITLNSFSKVFFMSGWRLGFAIGPAPLIAKMGLMMQTIFSCMPVFVQRGGIKALSLGEKCISREKEELNVRREVIVEGLNSIKGIRCLKPDGAFYVFCNIKKTGMGCEEFSDFLLKEAGVAVLPGKCFGKYGEGYVRLCYASTPGDVIKEAIQKIKEVV